MEGEALGLAGVVGRRVVDEDVGSPGRCPWSLDVGVRIGVAEVAPAEANWQVRPDGHTGLSGPLATSMLVRFGV